MTARHSFAQRLLFFLAGRFGKWLITLLYVTVRTVSDQRSQAAFNRSLQLDGVYAFWHAHQLSILWHNRHTRTAILVSQSRDGEYIARIAASFGYRPVRGSSSRGGSPALKELVRLAVAGHSVAVTPDGPRGPRHRVHPGVLLIAQKSGRPIVPAALGLSRYWELPSWDRFRIAKPFARGFSCWGEPLHVPPDADDAALAELAGELRKRLIALQKHADECARRM